MFHLTHTSNKIVSIWPLVLCFPSLPTEEFKTDHQYQEDWSVHYQQVTVTVWWQIFPAQRKKSEDTGQFSITDKIIIQCWINACFWSLCKCAKIVSVWMESSQDKQSDCFFRNFFTINSFSPYPTTSWQSWFALQDKFKPQKFNDYLEC